MIFKAIIRLRMLLSRRNWNRGRHSYTKVKSNASKERGVLACSKGSRGKQSSATRTERPTQPQSKSSDTTMHYCLKSAVYDYKLWCFIGGRGKHTVMAGLRSQPCRCPVVPVRADAGFLSVFLGTPRSDALSCHWRVRRLNSPLHFSVALQCQQMQCPVPYTAMRYMGYRLQIAVYLHQIEY